MAVARGKPQYRRIASSKGMVDMEENSFDTFVDDGYVAFRGEQDLSMLTFDEEDRDNKNKAKQKQNKVNLNMVGMAFVVGVVLVVLSKLSKGQIKN